MEKNLIEPDVLLISKETAKQLYTLLMHLFRLIVYVPVDIS